MSFAAIQTKTKSKDDSEHNLVEKIIAYKRRLSFVLLVTWEGIPQQEPVKEL